jgi:hypothetical protein
LAAALAREVQVRRVAPQGRAALPAYAPVVARRADAAAVAGDGHAGPSDVSAYGREDTIEGRTGQRRNPLRLLAWREKTSPLASSPASGIV